MSEEEKQELEDEVKLARDLELWSAIAIDSTQLCLTTFAIIYLARHDRYKQMSWKIRIQIALLWLLPLMFSTCNIWMVIH